MAELNTTLDRVLETPVQNLEAMVVNAKTIEDFDNVVGMIQPVLDDVEMCLSWVANNNDRQRLTKLRFTTSNLIKYCFDAMDAV